MPETKFQIILYFSQSKFKQPQVASGYQDGEKILNDCGGYGRGEEGKIQETFLSSNLPVAMQRKDLIQTLGKVIFWMWMHVMRQQIQEEEHIGIEISEMTEESILGDSAIRRCPVDSVSYKQGLWCGIYSLHVMWFDLGSCVQRVDDLTEADYVERMSKMNSEEEPR